MEPKLPAPNFGHERAPLGYGQNIERAPMHPTPESGIEQKTEKVEQRSEMAPATEQGAPTLPAPVIPAVPTPAPPVTDANVSSEDNAIPLVANDDDLIEKEWVDKAKKIIVETKDDPYRREQEVGKLQVDYLRKRYGKELGVS